jgi:hypothetical protein
MSTGKVLTKAIAEKFLKNKNSVDLSEFTSIDDNAAQALARHKGYLDLSSLTSLSDTAAHALAPHKGHIFLNGLQKLSANGASQLVKLPSVYLFRSKQSAGAQRVFKEAGTWSDSWWTRNR